MIVRHDVAVFADDDTASGTFCDILLHPAVGGDTLGPDLNDAVLRGSGDLLDRHVAAGGAF